MARLRQVRGLTQVELAEQMGLRQALVSHYERDKLRLNAEMAVRFALALGVTTDELLGLAGRDTAGAEKPPQTVAAAGTNRLAAGPRAGGLAQDY